jgi:flagellin-like hook-associated protein FlgL
MASNITLSAGVRQNLLALQSTAQLLGTTQTRLATGKKVNSALDGPTNFFTSSALMARAGELSNLLDSMSNGINTIKAADNGLTSITTTIETMQATITQARQDSSWQSESYAIDSATIGISTAKNLSFSSGAVTGTVNVALQNGPATAGKFTATNNFAATTLTDALDTIAFDIAVDGGAVVSVLIDQAAVQAEGNLDTTIDDVTEFNAILATAGVTGVTASIVSGKLTLTSATTGAASAVAITNYVETDADNDTTEITGLSAGASTAGTDATSVKTVDELVTAINTALAGQVKASNDAGQLRITNLSTSDLTVAGIGAGGVDGSAGTDTVAGNSVRANLVTQFTLLRDQLDKTADDSSFNGVNLLKGDAMKLFFNETSTSTLTIQSIDANGINNTTLGITAGTLVEFQSNTSLDTRLSQLRDALIEVRSQAAAFGANLSIVNNRQDFTKSMINTLQVGSDALVLADLNEEGANMLALQTRQQLSITALSLASQAEQGVLRLF